MNDPVPVENPEDSLDYENMSREALLMNVVLSVKKPVTADSLLYLAGIDVKSMTTGDLDILLASVEQYKSSEGKYYVGGEGTPIGHKIIADKYWRDLLD